MGLANACHGQFPPMSVNMTSKKLRAIGHMTLRHYCKSDNNVRETTMVLMIEVLVITVVAGVVVGMLVVICSDIMISNEKETSQSLY
jgi:hypothetical protein